MVLIIFTPILLGLFFLLPTYARVFRENAWTGNTSPQDATQLALHAIIARDDRQISVIQRMKANHNQVMIDCSSLDIQLKKEVEVK